MRHEMTEPEIASYTFRLALISRLNCAAGRLGVLRFD
jgi:hypothetical protein